MEPLSRQRCLHHPERQAVARCPECGRFHCRECIAEHDDRVLCAGCLKKLTSTGPRRPYGSAALRLLVQSVQLACGIFVIWLFFYGGGRILLAIPSTFHDGTVWNAETWDQED